MIVMILSLVGESRTLCVLVFLYFLKIYAHVETCALHGTPVLEEFAALVRMEDPVYIPHEIIILIRLDA